MISLTEFLERVKRITAGQLLLHSVLCVVGTLQMLPKHGNHLNGFPKTDADTPRILQPWMKSQLLSM